MSKKIRVAILISGRGSNMKALIDACKHPDFPAEISLVISNKADAEGLQYAKANHIPTKIIESKNFSKDEIGRTQYDKLIFQEITASKIDLICLAGFMRILSKWFVENLANKIINIHPSLLPSFKGANAVLDALKAGVKIAGCTTHFVTQEMDAGPIIMQSSVEVSIEDDFNSLSQKILMHEHKIYPETLKIISKKILNNL
ncbi:MAG: phosphoribosylglycinamide formyltransferase [Alphaproteobacteria bacterium]